MRPYAALSCVVRDSGRAFLNMYAGGKKPVSLLAFVSSFSRTLSGRVPFFLCRGKDNKPDYYAHISALIAP